MQQLGYFLKPSELFHAVAQRGNTPQGEFRMAAEKDMPYGGVTSNFILGDLASILKNIEQSTMSTESEDDFDKLFEDLDSLPPNSVVPNRPKMNSSPGCSPTSMPSTSNLKTPKPTSSATPTNTSSPNLPAAQAKKLVSFTHPRKYPRCWPNS